MTDGDDSLRRLVPRLKIDASHNEFVDFLMKFEAYLASHSVGTIDLDECLSGPLPPAPTPPVEGEGNGDDGCVRSEISAAERDQYQHDLAAWKLLARAHKHARTRMLLFVDPCAALQQPDVHSIIQQLKKERYQHTRLHHVMAAAEFDKMEMDVSESVETFARRFDTCHKNLLALVYPSLDDYALGTKFLTKLPTRFASKVLDGIVSREEQGAKLTFGQVLMRCKSTYADIQRSETTELLNFTTPAPADPPRRAPVCDVEGCGRRHYGGRDKCWKLHPDLEEEYYRKHPNRRRRGSPRNTTPIDAYPQVCLYTHQQPRRGCSCTSCKYLDCAASTHMTDRVSLNYTPDHGPPIALGNGTRLASGGRGDEPINNHIIMREVLQVPSLDKTLVSVGQSTGKGISFIFQGDSCRLYPPGTTFTASHEPILTVPKVRNMYPIPGTIWSQHANISILDHDGEADHDTATTEIEASDEDDNDTDVSASGNGNDDGNDDDNSGDNDGHDGDDDTAENDTNDDDPRGDHGLIRPWWRLWGW